MAINRFDDDTEADINEVINHFGAMGIKVIVATHYANGGAGALELAEAVIDSIENSNG